LSGVAGGDGTSGMIAVFKGRVIYTDREMIRGAAEELLGS
jgi:hypothetical protein